LPTGIDCRRLQEQPLGIVGAQVAKPGLAPDRAVDAADPDLEARSRAQCGDAVGEEAMAGVGVEEEEKGGKPQHRRQYHSHQPFGSARQPAPPTSGRKGNLLPRRQPRLLVHQKACPSET
jgi:hypothetical protein